MNTPNPLNTLNRLVQGGVIAGFLLSSSGCIIAPDRDHGGDRERVVVREHDGDGNRERHDRDDRHCEDRDEHCRDH